MHCFEFRFNANPGTTYLFIDIYIYLFIFIYRRGRWARFATQKRHCPQRPKTRQYFGLQQILQIRVLQIRVLQIRVLQIQSVFYKSNPVRVLQYAIYLLASAFMRISKCLSFDWESADLLKPLL